MNAQLLSRKIKNKAHELGFLACGIAEATFLEEEAPRLEKWLEKGHHGKMNYMENHFDMRLDPRIIVDGAKSVISVLLNYYPEKELFPEGGLKISRYAYGQDYHYVLKDRLKDLLDFIEEEMGTEINARCFTDSAPVLDKAWAEKCGLGWIGKNANLLSKQVGSYFFIGEIILDVPLEYDEPVTDHCGSCTKCIDACPTEAIIQPYVVDGSKCISYLTIELKDELIPDSFSGKMENWVFGCDICQEVCPWNRFSLTHQVEEFKPNEAFQRMDLEELTEEAFRTIFKKSAVKRTKWKGIQRNIAFVRENNRE